MTDRVRPRIVLVPGAWVGPDEFSLLVPQLSARGWEVTVPSLASTGSRRGLPDDVHAIAEAIDQEPGPVVLVAHSYGGAPATEAATHPRVQHLVYIAGFPLDVGESIADTLGGELPAVWHAADGYVSLGTSPGERYSLIEADLPAGAPHELVERISAMFGVQSLASFVDPVEAAGWRVRPTTYVLTELDRILEPDFQEVMAERAGSRVVRFPSGHAPFISHAEPFAAVLDEILRSAELYAAPGATPSPSPREQGAELADRCVSPGPGLPRGDAGR